MAANEANIRIDGGVNYDTLSDAQIIEWFSPLNQAQKQQDVSKVHQPGSGLWFLQDPVFHQWLASDRKALWAHGIPGAGKTVLISIVADHLKELGSKEPSNRVACIYCEYSQGVLQSPENLLASIGCQLLPDQNAISPALRAFCQQNDRGRTRPTMKQVMSVLIDEVVKSAAVSILIDAVDELEPKVQKVLLENIKTLIAMPELKQTQVRLMVSSRQQKSLFPDAYIVEIATTDDDMRMFVEKCIEDGIVPDSEELSTTVQEDLELRSTIVSAVVNRSKGM
ncbi:MAG: hypothetical protein Q9174_003309 [Haloplaca sp. 1 TL-2023]